MALLGFIRRHGRIIPIIKKASKGVKKINAVKKIEKQVIFGRFKSKKTLKLLNRGHAITRTLTSIRQNNPEVRKQLAERLWSIRGELKSGKKVERWIDIVPLLKGFSQKTKYSAPRVAAKISEGIHGTKLYKKIGRGGPIDARFEVNPKGLPVSVANPAVVERFANLGKRKKK